MQRIKVVVLDDSLFYREAIQQKLQQDVNISVVGKASNPYAARDMIVEHLPDLLIADINLGGMSGIDFIEQLLPQYSLPVIMISSQWREREAFIHHNVIDFIPKPDGSGSAIGRNDVFFRRLLIAVREIVMNGKAAFSFHRLSNSLIAVGASTGGTDAIETLIQAMPAIVPPIVIAQHMAAGFTASFAARLNRRHLLSVKEAADGDLLIPGQVYIAPGNYDMEVVRKNQGLSLAIRHSADDGKAHPNVDMLFWSAAGCRVADAVGILLTGMGRDGAYGLQAMRRAGYTTIVQDKDSSVVYGMPRFAMEIGAVDYQLPLSRIAAKSLAVLQQNKICRG